MSKRRANVGKGGLSLTLQLGEGVKVSGGDIEIHTTMIQGSKVKLRFKGTAKIDRMEERAPLVGDPIAASIKSPDVAQNEVAP